MRFSHIFVKTVFFNGSMANSVGHALNTYTFEKVSILLGKHQNISIII